MLKDGAEERIKKRLDKLKSHQARNYFLSNIAYPIEEKKYDAHLVNNSIKQIEEMLPKILELIKEIKKYFKDIYDQNNIVASYLLLGKAYKNLQSASKLGFPDELTFRPAPKEYWGNPLSIVM